MELADILDRLQYLDDRLEELNRRVEELEGLNRKRQTSTRYTPHVDYRDVPFWETEEKSN